MALFSRKFKQPLRGTATVAGSTACPSHASSASCRMTLVVSVPGVPATPTEHTEMVRADKWPFAGTVLPIEIDLAKPSRLRILWDEVPSGRQRAADAAAQMAARLNAPGAAGVPGAAGAPGVAVPGAAAPASAAPDTVPGLPGFPAAVPGLPGGFQIPPGARVVSSTTTINGQPASAEQIGAIESMIGMDLNGDGVVGPPQQ